MTIIDQDIHLLTNWEKHVGADIGGPVPFRPPDSYGWVQHPDWMKFYTKGAAYTDWLAANHRPLLPNTGQLTLSFDLMTDANAVLQAQAHEFDTRLSVAGWNYNLSFQLNNQRNGLLQLSGQDNKWVDTPYSVGRLTPGVIYPISLHYVFDVTAHTYQTREVRIGPERFLFTDAPLTAQQLGWADGAHLQVQLDLASAGGSYAIYVRKMNYLWS